MDLKLTVLMDGREGGRCFEKAGLLLCANASREKGPREQVHIS